MNFDLDIWTYINWKCDFKMYFFVTVSFILQGILIGQGWHMACQYFHKPYQNKTSSVDAIAENISHWLTAQVNAKKSKET